MPAFDLSFFLVGCLGGLLPDALRLARNRYQTKVLDYLKTVNFWLGLLMLALVGGLTVWVLGLTSAKDALIYGYAAPAVISQLVASITPNADGKPAVRGGPAPARNPQTPAKQGGLNLIRWWKI
ncbi:MAG: hypothetical protein WBM17_12945 [Anaerolineales bacterium]